MASSHGVSFQLLRLSHQRLSAQSSRLGLSPGLYARLQQNTTLCLRQPSTRRAFHQRRNQTTYITPGDVAAPNPAKPRRSLPVRVLWGAVKYGTLGFLFFFTGAYLGFTQLPNRDALTALFSKVPTNDETLTLYQPSDLNTTAINNQVVNHPLCVQLRANPAFTESRPHLKIPREIRPTNLTAGTLMGDGLITVPPVVFNEEGGKSMVSVFHLGDSLCGHPGIVHGGLLATLLDEGLARCCFPALPNKLGVTATLKLDYRKPSKAPGMFALKAETVRTEGRKAWVKGWIESLEPGQEGVKLVEAEALFIEPRNAKLMRSLYRDYS